MKFKNLLIDALITVFLGLLFGVIGIFVGDFYFIDDYHPPWTHYHIQSTPQKANDILHVDIVYSNEDPSGDTIVVGTDTGEIYSNTLFQKNWSLIETTPDWGEDIMESCAPEWPGPSDSHIWDPPPVDKGVIDSVGFRFERPLSITTRCYVLLADGSIEAWTNYEGAYSSPAMAIFYTKIFITLIGIFLGLDIGIVIIIIRKRLRKLSDEALKEESQ